MNNSKYNIDDIVRFKLINEDNINGSKEYELEGEVCIIDFDEKNEDLPPLYSILVRSGEFPATYPCLFKNIDEDSIELIETKMKV